MKKLTCPALFFLFFFAFTRLAFADCSINQCQYPEHGQLGTCQEGSVLYCDNILGPDGNPNPGWRECVNDQWVETTETTPRDLCSVTYRTGVWLEPTAEQYDQNVQDDAKNGTVDMWSYGYANLGGIGRAIGLTLGGSKLPVGEGVVGYGGGAIGAGGNIIAMLYQKPPASTAEYIAYVTQKAGFVSKAYAQGVGFRGFTPLIRIWSAMRNTAYLFFAFLLIVVGVLIIFRVRIDPRTVVTVQTALPRIVIAILLVTFSYAIVGLLVDVMNVLIAIAIWLFYTAGLIDVPRDTLSEIQGNNVLGIVIKMFGGEILCGTPLLGGLCQFTGTGPGWAINQIIYSALGQGIGLLVQGVGIFTSNWMLEDIFLIALAVSVFKLLFNLIMAYVSIVLSVILGPIQIALHAIPNWNTFKSWVMGIMANLAVFPTIAVMLMLGAALTGKSAPLGVTEFPGMAETGWWPPLLGGSDNPDTHRAILLLLGYGIILMTPGMVDRVKKLFQVPPAEMPVIGAALGRGAAPISSAGRLGVRAGREWGATALETAAKSAASGSRRETLLKRGAKLLQPR